MDEVSLSQSSDSSNNSNLTPRPLYRHEHPTYTFNEYMGSEWVNDYHIANPTQDIRSYLGYVREVRSSSDRRQLTYEQHRTLTELTCNCVSYRRLKFCLHCLDMPSGAKTVIKKRGVRSQLDANGIEFPANVMEMAETVAAILTPFNQRETTKCDNCKQVFYTGYSRRPKKHTCDPENSTQFGPSSDVRLETSFPGPDNTRIIIDTESIMLSFVEYEYVASEIYHAHVSLQKLGIDTNIIQVILQDPLFVHDQLLLLKGGFSNDALVYYLYLYFKFRLTPHLNNTSKEDVEGKIIPLFLMIERFSDGHPDMLLLGDTTDRILDHVNAMRDLDIGYHNRLRPRLRGLTVSEDTSYLNEQVFDGLSAQTQRSSYLKMVQVLGRTRPVSRGWLKFIESQSQIQNLSKGSIDMFGFFRPPLNNANCDWYSEMTNIFGVIPNPTFLRINEVIGLVALLDSVLPIYPVNYRTRPILRARRRLDRFRNIHPH